MRINPVDVLKVPWRVVEIEYGLIDRARKIAATAIYQNLSSGYIAQKLIEESQQKLLESQRLEMQLDEIVNRWPVTAEKMIDLSEDVVIDLRETDREAPPFVQPELPVNTPVVPKL